MMVSEGGIINDNENIQIAEINADSAIFTKLFNPKIKKRKGLG